MEVIKRLMQARDCWQEIESFNSLFNLKWQQTYHGMKYNRLTGDNPKQLVNHFEYHPEISTKNGLVKNLSRYCKVSHSSSRRTNAYQRAISSICLT